MNNDLYTPSNIAHSTDDYNLFYREVSKVMRGLKSRSLDKLFIIKYKGYKFNCLPFILNSSGFFSVRYINSLTQSIVENGVALESIDFDAEMQNIDNLDVKIFDSLLPAFSNSGLRCLGAYYYKINPREMVRLLFRGALEVLQATTFAEHFTQFEYKYNEICNTQAFCYYISIEWVLSLSPLLRKYINKELRHSNFESRLSSFCPEESIHFKYIKGELDSSDLAKAYKEASYEDGSSVLYRELMSNATWGSYNGEDITKFEQALLEEVYDCKTLDEKNRFNMQLAYTHHVGGTYKRLAKELESNKYSAEKNSEEVSKIRTQVNDLQGTVSSLKKELSDKDSEISKLKHKVSSFKTDKDLQQQVEELKSQVSALEEENDKLFNERSYLKQTISSQIKQIKSLSSRVIDDSEDTSENEVVNNDTVEPTIEEMASILADKKIMLVGGKEDSFTEQWFKDRGIKNVSRLGSSTRTLGKCDYVVIFTIRCCHADVFHVERLAKSKETEIVYYNGLNLDGLVRLLYATESQKFDDSYDFVG